MDISLKGKHALICGSSQGIGLAAAKELALNGANCILIARNPEVLAGAVQQLTKQGNQEHRWMAADFSDPAMVEKTIKSIVGKHTVEILVNNTGGPKAEPILEAPTELFELIFRQHVICNQILARTVVPGMKEAGYGRIINIISTSVKTPLAGLGVSNTIRLAVAAWAKTLVQRNWPLQYNGQQHPAGLTETQRLKELMKHSLPSQKMKRRSLKNK